METVLKFNKKLSPKQLKMAIEVLKAIGLHPVTEEKQIKLDEWQKAELANRIKNTEDGNFRTKEQAHKVFDECLK